MRLRQRSKRAVYLYHAGGAEGAYGSLTPAYGEGTAIEAVIQPNTSSLAAQAYGLSSGQLWLMLYDGPAEPRQGDGVGLSPGAGPEYRVLSAHRWEGHTACDLEAMR